MLWCLVRQRAKVEGVAAARESHGAVRRGRALGRLTAGPAAVVLVLVTPVLTWWLVGDLSTVPARAGRDYAVRPWDISAGTARAMGTASLVMAIAALVVLGWATRRRLLRAQWWTVLIPLLAAGVMTGAGWRVMTAGVIGANIGAGFVVIFGGPLVATLLLWAAARAAYLLVRAHRAKHPPTGIKAS